MPRHTDTTTHLGQCGTVQAASARLTYIYRAEGTGASGEGAVRTRWKIADAVACFALVTEPRLTRQELGWLLAQEARGAAKSLRAEVTQLRASIAPPSMESEDRISVSLLPGEQSLRALDQAISMLNQLESGPKKHTRRARLDLAALLYELAPNCRIALQPGAGTEVFGDEASFRRLLHMLLSQGPGGDRGSPGEISIRREGDWIRIGVDLGPDTSATSDLERRWLSRMSQQQGGRLELQGRTQTIVLPAEQSSQAQVVELKKELDQAQQLGEIYARELASVVSSETQSRAPEAQNASPESLAQLRVFATALVPQLTQVADLLAKVPGAAEALANLREVNFTLTRLSTQSDAGPRERVDVGELLNRAIVELQRRAQRRSIEVTLKVEGACAIEHDPKLLGALCYALLAHALSASLRNGTVILRARGVADAVFLESEDAGPGVPSSTVADLLDYRIDPLTVGRPRGLPLLMLHTLCKHIINTYLDTELAAVTMLTTDNGKTLTRVRLARHVDPG